MRLRPLLPGLLLALPLAAWLAPGPALGQQQGQDWFIPGQQRPQGQGQAQPAQQRPGQPGQAQPPGQRPAAGQRPPAPVIAMLDVQEVNRLSAAFNQVREEIERRRARLNDDLQREQGRWREEQQALAGARATLPPEVLRDRERQLQDRITDSQRIFRDRQRAIEASTQVGLQQIEQALGAVIRQVASSRGVNLVLPRPLIIFNDAGFDITEEVTAQLNRVLRTVNLPAEGQMPPEAAAAEAPAPAPAPAPRPANAPAPAPARPPAPQPSR
ncbi:OmpH family outer membrane protein [Falsiroseomonas sp. HW251]|uniref:OmpH family outer membrane protein n=1 Tax=Falsiroseomonas sp. HW251 TaxID=3390998 RepID=UPI003D320289